MKSGKQRRTELRNKRVARVEKRKAAARLVRVTLRPIGAVVVNPNSLSANPSYDDAEFVRRGYYIDVPFECVGCGKQEIWTATQQKWWYEVAKGAVFSTANRCRICRRHERERSAEARRVHLEGVAPKTGEPQT